MCSVSPALSWEAIPPNNSQTRKQSKVGSVKAIPLPGNSVLIDPMPRLLSPARLLSELPGGWSYSSRNSSPCRRRSSSWLPPRSSAPTALNRVKNGHILPIAGFDREMGIAGMGACRGKPCHGRMLELSPAPYSQPPFPPTALQTHVATEGHTGHLAATVAESIRAYVSNK